MLDNFSSSLNTKSIFKLKIIQDNYGTILKGDPS